MKKLHDLELLAPAGGPESIAAAVLCGADAVYVGQKSFSARASAHNFDKQELLEAVRYCHERGAKVYQTVNTLAFDGETPALAGCIETAAACGVDGLIVQDLGTAALAGKICPSMRLHASTQMTIHTPDGVKEARRLGFVRAVLARELSLTEIAEIHRAALDMELEVFVHGALCMSVSGQCYLSAMLGGRSGNRGQCAQPCRLPFSSTGKPAKDLSLKDLCGIEDLDGLRRAGVTSLKIEGRMKRPEYVAAAVSSYHKALGGQAADVDTLRAVFSRSGFTAGYLEGKLSPAMFGSREKEDVTAAAGVLKGLANLYKQEMPRVGVTLTFSAENGLPITLSMEDGEENRVFAKGEPPERALHRPTGEEDVKKALEKLGGTPFYAESINIQLEEGLMIPASHLNALRRECCEKLLLERGKPAPKPCFPYREDPFPEKEQENKKDKPFIQGRFLSADQLPENADKLTQIILPYKEVAKHPELDEKLLERCILELPRAMFGWEKIVKKELAALRERGYRKLLIQNIAQLSWARELGFSCQGGFGLNVTNSLAARRLWEQGVGEFTLSFELTLSQARRIQTPGLKGVIAYGCLPLMLTRNCPVKNQKSCRECGKRSFLTDRKGERFPVRCSEGYTELFNSAVLYLADRLEEWEWCDFLTLYFTSETKEQCAKIIHSYAGKKQHKPAKLTRGLYYRGVL